MRRLWQYKDSHLETLTPAFIAVCDNNPVLAKLLAIRGITEPEEVRAFLHLEDYIPTPGTAFPEMEKAVVRITQAVEKQESILVYGDFDVDGITGTSVLMECLRLLGAKVTFYIPDRQREGHGLNSTALCRLVSARQTKLVITTDTGITNFNEVALLNGLHVDTIITDHHDLPEQLPMAYATLNPKLLPASSPLAHLAGVGVAFKLSESLLHAYQAPQAQIDALLDLVAIGTVVDMVPLLKENRYLVWRGLQVLQRHERLGVSALLVAAGMDKSAPINSQTLGFTLGPRLNASGRLADAAEAVVLLTSREESQIQPLAAKLEQWNRQRKEMVEQCMVQAETHLMQRGELTDQNAIILASPDWHAGVVGLVATKLIEKYHRPCFIGYIDADTQEARFSARSIPGFHLHDNLKTLSDLFIRWGGHAGAAGFSVLEKDLPRLKQRLFALCKSQITEEQLIPITTVDMVLTPDQVNPYLVGIVEKLAPCGQSNPAPIFALEHVVPGAQQLMGDHQQHLKLILNGGARGQFIEAVYWNWPTPGVKLSASSQFRLAFTAGLNTFQGTTKVQLLLKDVQDEAMPSRQEALPPESDPQVARNLSVKEAVLTFSSVTSSSSNELQWVDHRHRDALEAFLGQMISLSAENVDNAMHPYKLFSEGTGQTLPFPVPEAMMCDRGNLTIASSSEHLILWDLPPDMPSLIRLLRLQQPRVVHLMGGKYASIPLNRPPHAFLEGMYRVLAKLKGASAEPLLTLDLTKLATRLSTTVKVVVTSFSVFQRLELLAVTVLPTSGQVQLQFLPGRVPTAAMFGRVTEMIEGMAFQAALQEVSDFREWFMSAPLPVIQSWVSLEMVSGVSGVSLQRESHVVGVG